MIAHHPFDDSLARLAAGTLDAGPRLVVSTHIHECRQCIARVRMFEAVGGAMIDEATPVFARPETYARVMARLDAPAPQAPSARRLRHPELPPPLNAYEIGPWRFVHPGFRWRRVNLPESSEANVIMLRVAAGNRVPHHGHTGTEYTQVLSGSFSDAFGRYRAGDLIEMDEDVDHQPVVDAGGECVCLASVEGRLRFSDWISRLMQPLIGI